MIEEREEVMKGKIAKIIKNRLKYLFGLSSDEEYGMQLKEEFEMALKKIENALQMIAQHEDEISKLIDEKINLAVGKKLEERKSSLAVEEFLQKNQEVLVQLKNELLAKYACFEEQRKKLLDLRIGLLDLYSDVLG